MSNPLASELKKPGKSFRGAPFWAWNAKLEPEELREQIRIMKKMGLGGFFMHSRVGLNTEYLGRDWFDAVNACIDEAGKQGMDAWLYDEDRWPSGAAGGKVTKNFPEFRARFLGMRDCGAAVEAKPEEGKVPPETTDLAWFAVVKQADGGISSYRRVANPNAAHDENEALVCFYEEVCATSPWYNGGTYLDTLNVEAVRKFVEITHEKYLREVGSAFGKRIPGIFTDEPNFTSPTAWTGCLPKTFKTMHGYEVLDHLPELFFKVGDETFSKVRLHFKDTLTHLFVNAFGKTIGDWCGKHGLEFTGHVLSEDSLNDQTCAVGAAMRFYEHMQAPGIDLLTEHWQIFGTAKQCSSMARQFGRRRRLSETYGCTGWDFPLEGHKALGDWQMALGINLRCQHLAWYSMAATAKRDYPASISRQSPWHGVYAATEDYFSRIGTVLSEGKEVRDLLVVHPIESAWAVRLTNHEPAMEALQKDFAGLRALLLGANIDFDYGDEEVMSRHCRIDGSKLFVGLAAYTAVVVPELLTVRSSTLKILSAFVAAGGKVFYLGQPPVRVNGEKSEAAATAYGSFTPCAMTDVCTAVSPNARRVSIAESGRETEATLHLMSESGAMLSVFVCNTSAKMPDEKDEMAFGFVRDRVIEYPDAVLKIVSPERGAVYEVDTTSGVMRETDYSHADGEYSIPCALRRLESRLFVVTREKLEGVQPAKKRQASFPHSEELPAKQLEYTLSEPNVVVLDHARCVVDGVAAAEEQFILDIDKALRKSLGAAARGGHMMQPWVTGERKPERLLDISLTYRFNCEEIPRGMVALAMERPDLYAISLNGKPVRPSLDGFWMDPAIKRVVIPSGALQLGENELVLTGRYHQYLPGLEAIFLLGDFGVKRESVITALPAALDCGDWCPQGLENFSGNVVYTIRFGGKPDTDKRVVLRIPEWRGAALGISVNGGPEAFLPWPPYELDVTDSLSSSANFARVTVYGHRRNACGPFYIKGVKWPNWTGPGEMDRHDMRERELVPCGLLKPVELAF